MAHYCYDEVWKIPELSKIPVENGVSQNGLFGRQVEVEIKGKESPGKILVGDDDVAEEKDRSTGKTGCAGEKRNTGRTDHVSLKRGEMGEAPGCCKETVRRRTFTWIAMKMCEMFYQFNF